MIRRLKIGDVELSNNLILAPMAGVTDLPFRLLCQEQGAGLVCMEMVSAKAIYYHNKKYRESAGNRQERDARIAPAFGLRSGHHQRDGKKDRRSSFFNP